MPLFLCYSLFPCSSESVHVGLPLLVALFFVGSLSLLCNPVPLRSFLSLVATSFSLSSLDLLSCCWGRGCDQSLLDREWLCKTIDSLQCRVVVLEQQQSGETLSPAISKRQLPEAAPSHSSPAELELLGHASSLLLLGSAGGSDRELCASPLQQMYDRNLAQEDIGEDEHSESRKLKRGEEEIATSLFVPREVASCCEENGEVVPAPELAVREQCNGLDPHHEATPPFWGDAERINPLLSMEEEPTILEQFRILQRGILVGFAGM